MSETGGRVSLVAAPVRLVLFCHEVRRICVASSRVGRAISPAGRTEPGEPGRLPGLLWLRAPAALGFEIPGLPFLYRNLTPLLPYHGAGKVPFLFLPAASAPTPLQVPPGRTAGNRQAAQPAS